MGKAPNFFALLDIGKRFFSSAPEILFLFLRISFLFFVFNSLGFSANSRIWMSVNTDREKKEASWQLKPNQPCLPPKKVISAGFAYEIDHYCQISRRLNAKLGLLQKGIMTNHGSLEGYTIVK